ncbi:helicase-primase helicase subunit [Human alphaherpesvirus 1]|nr:helicase-primase helicase subunit [Human alphaherpesvirus 1]
MAATGGERQLDGQRPGPPHLQQPGDRPAVPGRAEAFLNFTSMHGVQPILKRIRELSQQQLDGAQVPRLQWFRDVAALESPAGLPLREFPFAVYLITGNAGSGKSTCVQTINEVLDCVVTGATRIAAQNMYAKLSGAFLSRPINTIFHEFGFRGNHVQAQLGQYPYTLTSNPALLEDLQRRDLTYYWEVILDLTKRALAASGGEESRNEFRALAALERTLGLSRSALTRLAPATHGALPAFTRSNVIVIDEAGLLGRHLLTAVVYCWWMINALYHTPQYAATTSHRWCREYRRRRRPWSRPSSTRNCGVPSPNGDMLTYLICNRTLREYARLSYSWAIFINNKRCVEHEFGNLMKVLVAAIAEEHMQFVDPLANPRSYITNPANLPGWTRLFSSHKEVSAYMAKLHAYLKVTREGEFVVFTLPVLTFVSVKEFDEYRRLTHQPGLTIEKWLTANASRITNYSRRPDWTPGHGAECSKQQLVVARNDVTYVLNSQIAVTARLRKLVFGFSGTFRAFEAVLRDDSFVKTQGETSVEFAYRFLSRLIFSGLISFYNFLQRPGLDATQRDPLCHMGGLTAEILSLRPKSSGAPTQASVMADAGAPGERAFDFKQLGPRDGGPDDFPDDDLDVIFAGLDEQQLGVIYYCTAQEPETTAAVHTQFALLKRAFLGRFRILQELFGEAFEGAPFSTYVDNVIFRGCEMLTGSPRGGLMSVALQTDNYTLMGYTYARVFAFADELRRRHATANVAELLEEAPLPYVVLRDQHGFMSVVNTNISEFVESIDSTELAMAINADYGISSKLAMTITRSQGLSLDKVAICFTPGNLRLNSAYVAMSRTTSSEFLRMNLNPLRERHERDDVISEHILSALRDPNVVIVY